MRNIQLFPSEYYAFNYVKHINIVMIGNSTVILII